ncbi:MAG: hypothetical protein KDA44_06765 [Planctomycetales bacterium]|nr:hypothetical protein [Planctomycetales bacterium]
MVPAAVRDAPAQQDWTTLHRQVAAAALLAPSAENTQPWRFSSAGRRLIVSLDRARTLDSDVDMMLDLTGIGACVENAVIVARNAGWETTVQTLETADSVATSALRPVAALEFSPAGPAGDPLAAHIAPRCTRRRMTATPPPTAAELAALSAQVRVPGVTLTWVTDRREIGALAKLVGHGNRIRFECREFHREFYDNLRLTPAAAQRTRDGLDLATLQLPGHVRVVLRALRRWSRMRIANACGFAAAVGRQARRETAASGALGLISVDQPTAEAFVAGGRTLQRVWLAATAADLALHPVAALPVFLGYGRRPADPRLSRSQRRLIEEMVRGFERVRPDVAGRTLQMAFRLGRGPLPPVRSVRRTLTDVYQDQQPTPAGQEQHS